MLKIGLTGGIGSGKSTVARIFADLGVPVLDADQIARELVQPGQPALDEIVQAFGPELIQNRHLDRTRLRDLIFHSPERKQRLEAILHPRIYQALSEQVAHISADYCILVIPLLFETAPSGFVDRSLVVDCPIAMQYARVRARDHLDDATITAILQSQISRDQRLARADDVIDNSGDRSTLRAQVIRLDARYRQLATQNRPGQAID